MISLFTFVGNPILGEKDLWTYIISDMSPTYKTCFAISILAMTMSTADSYLQTASIMISHDMVESIRSTQKTPYVHRLIMNKLVILVTGFLAMIITVYYPSIFDLMKFVYQSFIRYFRIIVRPLFILTIFGFRGTSGTVLIGMTTGILVMLVWTNLVTPKIGISGSIIAIIANGLATMGAHYLLPQPYSAGWAELDPEQKRMMQLIRAFKKHRKSLDSE